MKRNGWMRSLIPVYGVGVTEITSPFIRRIATRGQENPYGRRFSQHAKPYEYQLTDEDYAKLAAAEARRARRAKKGVAA